MRVPDGNERIAPDRSPSLGFHFGVPRELRDTAGSADGRSFGGLSRRLNKTLGRDREVPIIGTRENYQETRPKLKNRITVRIKKKRHRRGRAGLTLAS